MTDILRSIPGLMLCALAMFIIPATATAEEECLDCHRTETPGAVLHWEQSAHASAKVGCRGCHGDDHEAMVEGRAPVSALDCGRCHQQAFDEHTSGKHSLGLHSGWGCTRSLDDRDESECRFCHQEGSTLPLSSVQCARFLKQTSEMGELGCNRCHMVEQSCASCHTNHGTDLEIVRDPAVCAKCHMGPDHPQWEMWQTSQHGTLYRTGGATLGPTCQSCHMPGGTHDVSGGIATQTSGKPYPPEEAKARREQMVEICAECHSRSFSRTELARADAIRDQSWALVTEAQQIIADLHDRGLISPAPDERPPHPLRGGELVLDGQMLYEDTSHIERLLFKMKKYDLAKTYKGAYHQNPAYTHWYGNAELKMDLVDIRAEAQRLKDRLTASAAPVAEEEGVAAGNQSVQRELERLKNRFDRGALSAEEYARRKKALIEGYLAR